MTINQLYKWAKEKNKENCELTYGGDLELSMVVDYESTKDNIVGLLADTGLDEDYYGTIFDGTNEIFLDYGERTIKEKED